MRRRAWSRRRHGTDPSYGQRRDRPVRERADAHRIEDGSEADGAAEQKAGDQHARLDRRTDDTHRMTARGERGAEAVARSGTETGADVQAGGEAVAENAGDE